MTIRFGFVLLLLAVLAPSQVPTFSITSDNLPPAISGEAYDMQFTCAGAEGPVHWAISGQLPPGLKFDPATGLLSGSVGRNNSRGFTFKVTAIDSNAHVATRTFTIGTSPVLILRWNPRPALSGSELGGAVEVENRGRAAVDVTFIVVAINQANKAFALGYQRFSLPPGRQSIPFTSSLPAGGYLVHVDAIGEDPAGTISRSLLETGRDFTIAP